MTDGAVLEQTPGAGFAAEAVARPSSPPRRGRRPGLGRSVAGFTLAWALLVTGWELAVASGWLERATLPPPSDFIPYILNGAGSAGIGPQQVGFGKAIADTLVRVALGFGAGVVLAGGLGLLIAALAPFRLVGLPLVQTIAPIAPVAWVPVAIAVVGTGAQAAIFVVVMGIFATMTIATVAALQGVPEELVKAARSLGTNGPRLWLRVIVPAAAPSIATAVRLSFFTAWMAVLAGEMAGINSGLGALIVLGQQQFNMELTMAGLFTIGLLGFAADRLLLAGRRRLLWWEHRGRRGQAVHA